jgi:hypothetical protein
MFSRTQDRLALPVRDPARLLDCSETAMATENSNRQK